MTINEKEKQLKMIEDIAKQLHKKGFESNSNLSKSNVQKNIDGYNLSELQEINANYENGIKSGEIDEHKTYNYLRTMLKLELTYLSK